MQIGQDQRTTLMQLQLTGEIENLLFLCAFFFFSLLFRQGDSFSKAVFQPITTVHTYNYSVTKHTITTVYHYL